MPYNVWGLIFGMLLWSAASWATMERPLEVLRVYGPGGPHHVIDECAKLFEARHGVKVAVIRALPHDLEQRLREDGDIYFGGAEYMLEDFHRRNPDVLDMASAEMLHPRRIGILVRKGNPLGIRDLADLRREEVALLDVKLENMRAFHGTPGGLSSNIWNIQFTGQQGISAWLRRSEIDAWITYKSWHVHLQEESDFIEIPGDIALRFTPVALTRKTPRRQTAQNFINFLKSAEGRQVFEQHGWY